MCLLLANTVVFDVASAESHVPKYDTFSTPAEVRLLLYLTLKSDETRAMIR